MFLTDCDEAVYVYAYFCVLILQPKWRDGF